MNRSALCYLLVGLALLTTLFVWLVGYRRSAPAAPGLGREEQITAPLPSGVDSVVRDREPVSGAETVEGLLVRFWGARWPEWKDRYGKAGLDLGAPASSAELVPWDESQGEIRAKARIYYERGLPAYRRAFMARSEENEGFAEKELSGKDVDLELLKRDLAVGLQDIDVEMDYLWNRYVAELDAVMNQILAVEPEQYYPLVDLRSQEGGGSMRLYVEHGGWFALYRLRFEDFPQLQELEAEKSSLVIRRMRQMRSLIAAAASDGHR